MTDDPAKPPRFPYVAALLCMGCLGATVWTWMRYSYAWEIAPDEVSRARFGNAFDEASTWAHRMVTARGRVVTSEGWLPNMWDKLPILVARLALRPPIWECHVELGAPGDADRRIGVICRDEIAVGSSRDFTGRFGDYLPGTGVLYINATASRFTGASIAGLVVGAMGVFVFTAALRHWLGERRRFQEDTRGHNTGVERTSGP